jgi:hypothetical protein
VIIEVLVPVGESDGLLIVVPAVSWFYSLFSAARLLPRPWSPLIVTARWVIRIGYLTAPC